ncbi:Cytochrome P450 9e2 [Orchesella cincta]|uniref:Cytochrome P450 9e2 n=1 Tax=Orchesella cincta TaxID=48709 RepID=A0A1D2MN11_ORCCI|nr:Cytochrome P450 9e2 [Orchesella cincta]
MWTALVLVAVSSVLIYYFARSPNKYWKKYGVYQLNSSLADMFYTIIGKKSMMDTDLVKYKLLEENGQKYGGFVDISGPSIIVRDLDILKKIMIKDFDHFVDRRPFFNSKHEPILQKTLVSLLGDEWKGVRQSLTQTFTTGKIRRMMTIFNDVANQWVDHFKEEIQKGSKDSIEIEAQKETTQLTVENIMSAVFGLNAGVIRDPKSVFARNAHEITNFTFIRVIKFGISFNFPWLVDLLGFEVFDRKSMRFFEQIMSQGLQARMSGEIKRNDFMQLIAEARRGELKDDDELNDFEKDAQIKGGPGTKKNYLNDDTIAYGQLLGFFFAGFSTSSNVVSLAAYALAVHQDVQEKLREEVDSKLFKDGDTKKDIDYDELNGLVYMDMFLSEVLRKWPPLGRLERKCVKDYHDQESGLQMPKGTLIAIPISSLHNDPQYYEYPDKFYPEHFTANVKLKEILLLICPLETVCPRNCIGMRFAVVQIKSALAHLVHRFHIETAPSTLVPVQSREVGFGIQAPDNLKLKLRLRQK